MDGGYSQTFPAEFSQNSWSDQLVMYQAMFNTDDIQVSYLDEENDEIPITCQDELDYAYQVASNSTHGVLKLILRNSRNEIIDKLKLNIDPQMLKKIEEKATQASNRVTDFNLSTSIDSRITAMAREITETLPTMMTQTETDNKKEIEDYVNSQLEKFKQSFYQDLDVKIKSIIDSNVSQKIAECKDMIMLESFNGSIQQIEHIDLETKVSKLFEFIADAKKTGRGIKTALLEEELQSTGAFSAEFIADTNMPDGTICPPGAKFKKEWQIKNTGKLAWTQSIPVKLTCIGGTIFNVNTSVSVEETRVGEIARIRADLVAPNYSGSYFSEWVLTCNGIQFGPRVWCTIKVDAPAEGGQLMIESSSSTSQHLVNLMSSSSKHTPSPSEFEVNVNKTSSMCGVGQQMLQSYQDLEDLDDEFVVVPDCFDLTKKWTITRREEEEEENLVMIKRTDGDQTDTLNESVDIVDAANNTTIVSDEGKESDDNDQDSGEQNVNSESASSRSESAALVIEEQQQSSNMSQNLNISVVSSIDVPIRQLNIADQLKQLEERGCEACVEESHTHHTQAPVSPSSSATITAAMEKTLTALDKMKNAFSNLGTPSFVAGGLDLNNKPTETSQLKTMLLNQNKLLSMGFGNRALNERLLKKYNNDVDKVVEHLIERSDNDWMDSR